MCACACNVRVCMYMYGNLLSILRGVLESLIKKNFPTSDIKKTAVTAASGLDLTMFSDDLTLPPSLRKRLRGNGETKL